MRGVPAYLARRRVESGEAAGVGADPHHVGIGTGGDGGGDDVGGEGSGIGGVAAVAAGAAGGGVVVDEALLVGAHPQPASSVVGHGPDDLATEGRPGVVGYV